MTTTIKASTLTLDYSLYPRHRISEDNARRIREAMEAGIVTPPVIADRKTKKVIDGFHRVTAALQIDANAEIQVELRDYKDNAARFQDAIVLNANHGLGLTAYDRARCVALGQRFGMELPMIALALSTTADRIEKILAHKMAVIDGKPVPIKGSVRHLAGQELSDKQQRGMTKSAGSHQLFMVTQLINLIENDLLDKSNRGVMQALQRLVELIQKKKAA